MLLNFIIALHNIINITIINNLHKIIFFYYYNILYSLIYKIIYFRKNKYQNNECKLFFYLYKLYLLYYSNGI